MPPPAPRPWSSCGAGLIRRTPLRVAWQLGLVVLLGLGAFTAVSGVWAVVRTDRVPTPEPTLDGTAYLAETAPNERAAYEWLNDNVAGIPVIAEAYGPSYQDYSRVAMNTGLPIVLGWDYHVSQRAQRWPDINKRKDDLKKLYTTESEQVAADILRKYHIALVYVGAVERRAYAGGNLKRFQEWSDLLQADLHQPRRHRLRRRGRVRRRHSGHRDPGSAAGARVRGADVHVQGTPGQLSQPRGLALDADGNVYVADFGNDRIQKFDPQLRLREGVGLARRPAGAVQAAGRRRHRAATDTVYVADTWNQRVQVFSLGRRVPDASGPTSTTARAASPSARPAPSTWRTPATTSVRRFNKDGVEERSWGGLGKEQGQFTEPVGLAVDKDGKVYVVDNGNARAADLRRRRRADRRIPGRRLGAEGLLRAARRRDPERDHLGHRADQAADPRLRRHRQGAQGDPGRRRSLAALRPPDGHRLRRAQRHARDHAISRTASSACRRSEPRRTPRATKGTKALVFFVSLRAHSRLRGRRRSDRRSAAPT